MRLLNYQQQMQIRRQTWPKCGAGEVPNVVKIIGTSSFLSS